MSVLLSVCEEDEQETEVEEKEKGGAKRGWPNERWDGMEMGVNVDMDFFFSLTTRIPDPRRQKKFSSAQQTLHDGLDRCSFLFFEELHTTVTYTTPHDMQHEPYMAMVAAAEALSV